MKNKTWKRELAALLLIFTCYIALYGSLEVLKVMAPLTFLFAGGAFGIDSFAKQIQSRRNDKVQRYD